MSKHQCDYCQDSGLLDVLDLWSIERTRREYGWASFDSAAALPMLKQAVRCPKCQGDDATNADVAALRRSLGVPGAT